MTEKQSGVAQRKEEHLTHRPFAAASPFRMLERFANEMERMFEDFGLSRGLTRPTSTFESLTWVPRIDVTQRSNELVVHADLPGMSRDDVRVDVTEDAITIQGERRHEKEEEHGGVYRSERSYGSFYREIPLPQGAIPDQAKATFKDGVLEITMPAPP